MKINFLMSSFVKKPGGSHRVAYEYANYFANSSHTVRLIYPDKLSKFPQSQSFVESLKYNFYNFEKYIFKRRDLSWFKFHMNVEKIFVPDLTEDYIPDADIVVATAWQTAEYIKDYSQSKGAKIYIIHHDESLSGYPIERVRETWHIPIYKVAVSQWTYESVKPIAPERLFYIPNGINTSVYREIEPIESRHLCLCMNYSPRKIKDIQTGIEAILIAKERFPHLRVKLFGVFPKSSVIPNWAEYYHNRSDSFIVEKIYNLSSIFVCSSLFEGFGLSVAEAMACGCAIVTTDCGGVRDFAIHNKTALLSSPKDVDTLAENLCLLIQDNELRINLAYSGRDNIRSFSWDNSCNNFEYLVNQLIKENQ